jgi:formate dehydrogenase major subunit
VILIGANPTDAHPVFASRLKKRLRQGAKIIVIDPRAIDLVRSTHIEAAHHLPLLPGTNVAMLTALAHVIVSEGLVNEHFVRERCDLDEFQHWAEFVADTRHSPEEAAKITGVPAETIRKAARLYATGGNGAIYYGLGVTEHSQGSTTVMAIANLAMATGNIGRRGVGVNPLRGQNNVQGSCDMGSFPHELSGYRHISGDATREMFEALWGVKLEKEPGCACARARSLRDRHGPADQQGLRRNGAEDGGARRTADCCGVGADRTRRPHRRGRGHYACRHCPR